ncbi:MAG TPA: hypothetical protein VIW70_01100 [Rubrivivax sp.]
MSLFDQQEPDLPADHHISSEQLAAAMRVLEYRLASLEPREAREHEGAADSQARLRAPGPSDPGNA